MKELANKIKVQLYNKDIFSNKEFKLQDERDDYKSPDGDLYKTKLRIENDLLDDMVVLGHLESFLEKASKVSNIKARTRLMVLLSKLVTEEQTSVKQTMAIKLIPPEVQQYTFDFPTLDGYFKTYNKTWYVDGPKSKEFKDFVVQEVEYLANDNIPIKNSQVIDNLVNNHIGVFKQDTIQYLQEKINILLDSSYNLGNGGKLKIENTIYDEIDYEIKSIPDQYVWVHEDGMTKKICDYCT